MIPASYFYLIDIDTDEPLAVFSAEQCRSGNDLAALEGRIRFEHNVDDITSGLALRDSGAAPLTPPVLEAVMRRQARRQSRFPR